MNIAKGGFLWASNRTSACLYHPTDLDDEVICGMTWPHHPNHPTYGYTTLSKEYRTVLWERRTKGKYCCMAFEVKMCQILSKCTKYCQRNTKACQTIVNMGKMANMSFPVKKIFEKLHEPHQS